MIPLAEVGKRYMAHDLITLEDPTHVEVDGEGKRILIQLNKEFTYNGEPASDFAQTAVLKWTEQAQHGSTNLKKRLLHQQLQFLQQLP